MPSVNAATAEGLTSINQWLSSLGTTANVANVANVANQGNSTVSQVGNGIQLSSTATSALGLLSESTAGGGQVTQIMTTFTNGDNGHPV